MRHQGGFGEPGKRLIVGGNRTEQGRVETGRGQVNLEGDGALEPLGLPVDSGKAADQECGFEIIQVLAKRVLGHTHGFCQLLDGDFQGRVPGQQGEQAVQFPRIVDAMQPGQVLVQDTVGEAVPDESRRRTAPAPAYALTQDAVWKTAEIHITVELVVQRR